MIRAICPDWRYNNVKNSLISVQLLDFIWADGSFVVSITSRKHCFCETIRVSAIDASIL